MIKMAGIGKVGIGKYIEEWKKEWRDYARTLDFKNYSSEASLKHCSLSIGLKQATIILLAQINVKYILWLYVLN